MNIAKKCKLYQTVAIGTVIISALVSMNTNIAKNEFIAYQKAEIGQITETIDSIIKENIILKEHVQELEISTASTIKELELQIAVLSGVEEAVVETPTPATVPQLINTLDPTNKSGMTADQFDAIINTMLAKYNITESALIGSGKYLAKMEEDHNVNGLLALATTTLETGYGRSNLAVNKNNLFGIAKSGGGYRSFESVEESFDYYGNLLRTHYIDKGLTSIQSIGARYCPGSNDWVNQVTGFYNSYTHIANDVVLTL